MKWCKQNKLLSNGICLGDMQNCVKERCNQWQPFTQYDKIQCMSVEEMAEAIKNAVEDCEKHCSFTKNGKCNSFGDGDVCAKGIELWLESEADTE